MARKRSSASCTVRSGLAVDVPGLLSAPLGFTNSTVAESCDSAKDLLERVSLPLLLP